MTRGRHTITLSLDNDQYNKAKEIVEEFHYRSVQAFIEHAVDKLIEEFENDAFDLLLDPMLSSQKMDEKIMKKYLK